MHRIPAAIIAEACAPIAAIWLRLHEEVILLEGRPLDLDETELAKQLGIVDPTSVRISVVQSVQLPIPKFITTLAKRLGISLITPAAMSLNLGIYLDSSVSQSREILAHELIHTIQYQRLGGILAFMRLYIRECLEHGYQDSPLEIEARLAAQSVVN